MLNNRKIRLMTKLAVFETKDGKEDIRLSKYYKTDYVRYQVLKSGLSTTVGYLLILILAFLYKLEYIVKNAVSLDYKTIGSYILGIYILLITVYGLGSLAWFSFRYDASRKRLIRYNKLLKRVNKIYKEETTES